MHHFRAALRMFERFFVAKLLELLRGRDVARIGVEKSVDAGPDGKVVRAQCASHDGRGKIGAVAAECGDASFRSRGDKAGDNRNCASFEISMQRFVDFRIRLRELRMRILAIAVGNDEMKRVERLGIHRELAQRSGKEAAAPALAEGNHFVRNFGGAVPFAAAGNDGGELERKFSQLDAQLKFLFIAGIKIARDVQMELRDFLRFGEGGLRVAKAQSASDAKEAVGNAANADTTTAMRSFCAASAT